MAQAIVWIDRYRYKRVDTSVGTVQLKLHTSEVTINF